MDNFTSGVLVGLLCVIIYDLYLIWKKLDAIQELMADAIRRMRPSI